MKRSGPWVLGAASGATASDAAAALSALYLRWRKPLLRLFQVRLGNREQAEDATQEVFVRLATAGRPLGADEERAYLRTTARSVSIDAWRRAGQGAGPELVSLDAAAEVLELPQDGPPTLDAAADRERLARLDAAVSELPARQRQALLLNRIDGLTHDEVARAMGISARMVAKHLQRALSYCQMRVHFADAAQMQRFGLPGDDPDVAGGVPEREAS